MTIEEIAFECGVSTTAANVQMDEIRKSYRNEKDPRGNRLKGLFK